MKKRILALALVFIVIVSAVGCSNVGRSTANNRPGDFIFNALENTEKEYSDSISSVSEILSEALEGGSVKLSYNDSHYSVDNILYMDYENAKYTNLLDGQIYGENVNLLLQYNQSDVTMWSDGDLFTYDMYGDGYNAYKFNAEMISQMLNDQYNEGRVDADNPTNFDWLLYQLTRLMQINEDFREDFEEDLRTLFNEKFVRYSAESEEVDIDGNPVDCVVLKYNLDEYDIADILDTVLNNYLDYFYYLGATGIKKQCFLITDAIQDVKEYVEKSFADLDFTLTVAKDTKAIHSIAVSGSIDVAGEEAVVDGTLNLGRVASYLTPVTGSLSLTTDKDNYVFSIQTDASTADDVDSYRVYAAMKINDTTQDFADIYYTFDHKDETFSLYSNANGNPIKVEGTLTVDEGEKFEIVTTYVKIGNDEYYPDFKIVVKAKAKAPKAPSSPAVITEEYDEEGNVVFTSYDALKDIIDAEVRTTSVFQYYESVGAVADKIIRNSIFKNFADGIGDFLDAKVTPALDQYHSTTY